VEPDPFRARLVGARKAVQYKIGSSANLRQPSCHITHCYRVEFVVELALEARFNHAAGELKPKFLYLQPSRRVSRSALPYQPRGDEASVGAGRLAGRGHQVAVGLFRRGFLGLSFSTIFIIGEGAVSAFFVPTVRWRKTASL